MSNFILSKPVLHYQNNVEVLVAQTVNLGLGKIADNGALCVNTGKFTGRSPENKFFIKDHVTAEVVDWGGFNHAMETKYFKPLQAKMLAYLEQQNEIWIRDAFACSETSYQLPLRLYTELPWSAMFAHNMFIRPTEAQLKDFKPEWQIIHAPNFKADPAVDGTLAENFSIISFTEKSILIGGSAYTGEIKKGIFSVLNFILPHFKDVLSMHCSANVGTSGDVALFFGLSGTGKTTLSADPKRKLIGDDEHGWTNHSVFNFEGGCYAKCVDLSAEKEPQIFNAITFGSLLENISCFEGTTTVDYSNISRTENTRVSYPSSYIDNAVSPAVGDIPKNIFFLTCDAFGVLPPISRLTPAQAMYHFISGYTAKVAGTEMGVTEPTTTFSACFGKAFLPLHPTAYAELLGEKLKTHHVKVWLLNTGWVGGAYGTGSRIKLSYTRALISAALNGDFDKLEFGETDFFKLAYPTSCSGVPQELMNPKNSWADKAAYDAKARHLAEQFVKNFSQYAGAANAEILSAAPQVSTLV